MNLIYDENDWVSSARVLEYGLRHFFVHPDAQGFAFSTEVINLEEEEPLKTLALPLRAQTTNGTGTNGAAVNSLCKYKWRHQGDF